MSEPTSNWLQQFAGHSHLDAKGANVNLGGLKVGWADYLEALRAEPPFTVQVQLPGPPLTAAQRRNPYLAASASKGRVYEEEISPQRLVGTLMVTAECICREWAPELRKLALADRNRAERDASIPRLYSEEGKTATVRSLQSSLPWTGSALYFCSGFHFFFEG